MARETEENRHFKKRIEQLEELLAQKEMENRKLANDVDEANQALDEAEASRKEAAAAAERGRNHF